MSKTREPGREATAALCMATGQDRPTAPGKLAGKVEQGREGKTWEGRAEKPPTLVHLKKPITKEV